MARFRRRDFLRAIVVTAAALPLPACGSDDDDGGGSNPQDVLAVYPQGVASGDPRPESVILWTRAVPRSGAGAVSVEYEVALDQKFSQRVAQGSHQIDQSSDWTLRIKLEGLLPFTQYYYRFKAEGVTSDVGRTKTAPLPDQDVAVRFAFASCQDFIGRYYHSWRALVEEEAPVDFVVFLGDYVYETNGDPDFQLQDPERSIEIPNGISLEQGTDVKAAATLDDYRGLYRQYRSDAALKQAHRLFPFICIWDDHEFANDAWQDHATDFNETRGDEKSTSRREAANQAWFEYQPADVDYDESASFPDDLKIFRSLRYGKHVEIVLTDQRSYRDDHVIPEGADPTATPPGAPEYLTYEAAGHLFKNSSLGSRNFCKKIGTDPDTGQTVGFDAIEAWVKPTMLGAEQKTWLIQTFQQSTATWKFWGNQTQLLQMALDLSSFNLPDSLKGLFYFTVDQWDGYRSERAEILSALAGVENLVALTGDIHAFYAGELQIDFDSPAAPIGVEYVTAGISSSPAQEIAQNTVDNNELLKALGLGELVPNFDEILRNTNPHYKYAKSLTHGIAIVDVEASVINVSFVQISEVKSKDWNGSFERVELRTASGSNRVELV
jgi:alkaline phosphatase D